MSPEGNEDLVRRFFTDVFNGGDPAAAPEMIAADFVAHHPAFPDAIRGLAGLAAMGTMFRTAVPDLHYAVDDLVADGDKVAVRWTATGRNAGPLALPMMTVAATNRAVTVHGTDIFRIAGDRLAEAWVCSDFFGLMLQLGVLPPPGN